MYKVEDIKKVLIMKFYDGHYDLAFDPFMDKLVTEICDKNILCVNPLGEVDTKVLRDYLGINDRGVRLSQDKIGFNLKVSRAAISQRMRKIYSILKKRINVDYCGKLSSEKEKIFLLSKDIFSLGLSIKAYNLLKKNNINTVEDLVKLSIEDLKEIDFLGPKILEDIYEKVLSNGLEFGLETTTEPIETQENYRDLLLSEGIESLGLSNRAYNCLKRNYIDTIGDLVRNTYTNITQIKSLGFKASTEIYNVIHDLGLHFLDEGIEYKDSSIDDIDLLKKYKLLLLRRKTLDNQLRDVDDEIKNLEDNFINKCYVKK